MAPDLVTIKDQLALFGPVRVRAMFGGHGVYLDDLFIAIVVENDLYFKADAEGQKYFETFDSHPFTYMGQNRPVSMSYWKMPETVLKNQDLLATWVSHAVRAAHAQKNKKRNNLTPPNPI